MAHKSVKPSKSRSFFLCPQDPRSGTTAQQIVPFTGFPLQDFENVSPASIAQPGVACTQHSVDRNLPKKY